MISSAIRRWHSGVRMEIGPEVAGGWCGGTGDKETPTQARSGHGAALLWGSSGHARRLKAKLKSDGLELLALSFAWFVPFPGLAVCISSSV